jgi:multidrug resistance protein MdtO
MFLCAWVGTGGPPIAYAGLQMALAYDLINLSGFAINTSLVSAGSAMCGNLLGLGSMWLIYDHLWGSSSISAFRSAFIRNLQQIADVGVGPQIGMRDCALARRRVARAFEELQSLTDSMIFEPHVKNRNEHEIVRRISAWQPELRALSLIQFGLLEQSAKNGTPFPVSANILRKTSCTLQSIGHFLNGSTNEKPDEEEFSKLLMNVEEEQAGLERRRGNEWSQGNLQRELRLAHSLGVLARDVDKRIHLSIPENLRKHSRFTKRAVGVG